MQIAKRLAIAITSIFLAACSVPTTGIVPRDDGMYTVTRQGSSFMVTTDSLKMEALKEAGAFCEKKGAQLKTIHSKEIPAGPLGRWPESEVLFRCA
jgi:hypothetical protein